MSERAIVLSPHFDDAVLSCWTILVNASTVEVVTICSGIPPRGTLTRFDRIAGADDSGELMRLRDRENATVLDGLGVPHRQLDYLDNQYRGGTTEISVEGNDGPSPKELLSSLGDLDDSSVIYSPAALGGHVDHVLAREATLELKSAGHDVRLYADIPYAAHYGWPDWVSGADATPFLNAAADWDYYMADIQDRWTLTPEIVTLGGSHREEKLNAARQYATQFPSLNAGPLNRLVNPHTLQFEVYWSVR